MRQRNACALGAALTAAIVLSTALNPAPAKASGSCPKVKESMRFQVYVDVRRVSCGTARSLYHQFVHHVAPHQAGYGFKNTQYGWWGDAFTGEGRFARYTCRFKTLDYRGSDSLRSNSVYNLRCTSGPAGRKQVIAIRRRQDGRWPHTSVKITRIDYRTTYSGYSGLPLGHFVVHLSVCGPGATYWVNWQYNKKSSAGSGSIQRRQSGSDSFDADWDGCNDYTFFGDFSGVWSGGAHEYCFRAKTSDALWSGIKCKSRQVRYYAPY